MDLKLTGQIQGITENINLLEPDSLKNMFKSGFESVPYLSGRIAKVNIDDMLIDYVPVEDKDNPEYITMIPVWRFKLTAYDGGEAQLFFDDILINAIDGSLIEETDRLINNYQSIYDD